MKTFKPTLQQAFDAMLNGNLVLLSEQKRAEYQNPCQDEMEQLMAIEKIERDGSIALYSESMGEVLYDLECDDILVTNSIIEPTIVIFKQR